MSAPTRVARPGRIGWVVPLVLLLVTGIPPVQNGAFADLEVITGLIQSVLAQPWSESVPALLPLAKIILLAVAILGIVGIGPYPKVVLGYYAAILAVVAVLQNTATLTGGITTLTGNVVAELAVAVVCVVGLRHTTRPAALRRERWWLLPLMVWAWLYPFALDGATVVPGGWAGILGNGAGVTYCMITPVIAGTMALRPAAYDSTTRAIVGGLGIIFGVLNMVTWFAISTDSWWMGVLHLPLMIIAAFLTVTTWREPRT